jgi:hypothetical protein
VEATRGRPASDEAAAYYFRYIDRVPEEDVVGVLSTQLDEFLPSLSKIPEERSLYRYAPGKWSLRQVVNHVNDTERLFVFRALWFARGFETPLPSFDQDVSAASATADSVTWASHLEELRNVRRATVSFFRNLPAEAWGRRGVASGYPFSVNALAYIIAGHLRHHAAVVREKYA